MNKAGYEYLFAYKITGPIYDYTVVFCRRWVSRISRTTDQMVQAARSGMMNIAEGNKQKSLATYIKLTGVARGSLEELLKDYLSFARQRNLKVWSKERSIREIGEIREIWEILRRTPTIPDHPDFPDLPHNSEKAVNLMVTLIHQANYLLDRLVVSLEVKHAQEGGFSENMLKTRLDNRRRSKQRVC